jgi:hypothetical protein
LGGATNVRFDSSIDIRGRRVMDLHGADLGDVRDLYIDGAEKKLRFVVVAASGFLGIGQVRFILPVEVITRVRDHAVHIDRHRDHVVSSPAYDPALMSREKSTATTACARRGQMEMEMEIPTPGEP